MNDLHAEIVSLRTRMYGNGEKGMVTTLAVIETEVAGIRDDVKALKGIEKKLVYVATIIAALNAVGIAVVKLIP